VIAATGMGESGLGRRPTSGTGKRTGIQRRSAPMWLRSRQGMDGVHESLRLFMFVAACDRQLSVDGEQTPSSSVHARRLCTFAQAGKIRCEPDRRAGGDAHSPPGQPGKRFIESRAGRRPAFR
jgi:hypothetical protein